jgi:hypothetical protein
MNHSNSKREHESHPKLAQAAQEQINRLLNGKRNPQEAAIGHLASAAGRAAESLAYLAEIDDRRFKGEWLVDEFQNDAVDDGHVRWAATGALTSLDLSLAAASRLGAFSIRSTHHEASIRNFYAIKSNGAIVDKRQRVPQPWRDWLDGIVGDARYDTLLKVRHALVHADAFRVVHGTTGPQAGHSLRYGYNIGSLALPIQRASHLTLQAREIIELSRDVALDHVGSFIAVLKAIT